MKSEERRWRERERQREGDGGRERERAEKSNVQGGVLGTRQERGEKGEEKINNKKEDRDGA